MYNTIASSRVKSCLKGLNGLYFLDNCFVECENGSCKNMLQANICSIIGIIFFKTNLFQGIFTSKNYHTVFCDLTMAKGCGLLI